MNLKQIVQVLRRNKEFVGVFPSDKIPHTITPPAAFVANTNPQEKPGKHWVAFYIDQDRNGEYFHSYGRPPIKPFRVSQ